MNITREYLCKLQDHSLLGHCCPKEMVQRYVDEVLKYGFRSIVLGADNVAYAAELLGGRADIGAVVGFPQGASTRESKIFEAVDALKKGATEIDTVINFSRMRNQDYNYVKQEIADVVKAIKQEKPDAVTKFIIYFPYDQNNPLRLTEQEVIRAGEYIMEGGGDFIKYHIMHDFIAKRFQAEVAAGQVQLKWSGCPNLQAMPQAIRDGVTRFGTDAMPQWLEENPDFLA